MATIGRDGVTILDESNQVIGTAADAWSARRIVGALNLVSQAHSQHAFERGFIAPEDWDVFTAHDMIRVAEGVTTLNDIAWGQSPDDDDERHVTQEKLARWEGRVDAPLPGSDATVHTTHHTPRGEARHAATTPHSSSDDDEDDETTEPDATAGA